MQGSFYSSDRAITEFAVKGTSLINPSVRPIVLIVDDEPVITDTLAAILNQHGYTAFCAYNGEAALALARKLSPHIVLSDVLMPRMNGIQLASAIARELPQCKILLFSGQAATVDLLASESIASHRFTMLSKPIHPTELLAHISNVAGSISA